jgi:hypothetical protein
MLVVEDIEKAAKNLGQLKLCVVACVGMVNIGFTRHFSLLPF